jgi:cytochrome b pre-mRNA-processing protein 3
MILARWRARRANRILIEQIHGQIVAAARSPAFYAQWGVPDTLDGRFEMIVVHAGLVMRRLAKLGDLGAEIAQDLVDCVFRHFEAALREMAIGDAGVVKRMKAMIEAFYGRNRAYAAALDAHDATALGLAIARNVYGAADVAAAPHAPDLARYVVKAAETLDRAAVGAFSLGEFRFPETLPESVGDPL